MRLYNEDAVRWTKDNHEYCLVCRTDDDARDPRADRDTFTTMACFHPHYPYLGDKLGTNNPIEWWQGLVRRNVSEDEIAKAAIAGKLDGIRVTQSGPDPFLPSRSDTEPGCYDVYETCYLAGFQTSSEAEEYLEYSEVEPAALASFIADDLTIHHCQTLLKPYIEWLPLWLYDHGGITMSCGARTGVYADRWDSSAVGFIVAEKDTAMRELGATEADWRERVIAYMEAEVEEYDQWLTGDVYGYELYEHTEDGWNQIDSCWGFYGSDIDVNGAREVFDVPAPDKCKTGELISHIVEVLEFVGEHD